jgi:hypothetical protein
MKERAAKDAKKGTSADDIFKDIIATAESLVLGARKLKGRGCEQRGFVLRCILADLEENLKMVLRAGGLDENEAKAAMRKMKEDRHGM